MRAATQAHPSFGMTTTKTLRSVFSWLTSPKVLVLDSIPDCFNGSDEYRDIRLIQTVKCKDEKAFPCFPGDKICFHLHELCIYELHDHLGPGFLRACRNGKHLANCSAATCPHHYKCRNYYCVPFKYTCDGKLEFVLCHDEQNFPGISWILNGDAEMGSI